VDLRLPSEAALDLPRPNRRFDGGHLLAVVSLVFASYYLGARLGLALTFQPYPVSVLWPPNAILFAALLLLPPRRWWMVAVGALPAHLLAELQGGVPMSMVLCWFVSNVAEAVIGATCVRAMVARPLTFDRLLHVAAFLFAALIAAFLSSFLDSWFVTLNRWGSSGYWDVWKLRLLSNVTASLIVVPVIVTCRPSVLAAHRAGGRPRLLEGAVLATGLLAVTALVFDSQIASHAPPALIYLPLPFLLWAALRFGAAGASVSFALVAFLVIWGTGHAMGPFGARLPEDNALSVQLFLIFVAPTLLSLAAAMAERTHADEALRESDRRFQLVLQATRDTVYERDVASGNLWWSANGLAQFGYERDECPHTFVSWEDLVHREDRERANGQRATAIASGAMLWQSEFRLRRANGSYAHVNEQGYIAYGARGRPLQMVGAVTDITERSDADELSRRLAHASRLTAMGELTASIAHEINQPMSAILSNVDAAEMLLDAGEIQGDELRRILDDIRSDDLRASEVIRHIRGLANKRETQIESFDINELARAVLRLIAPVAERRGITVSASFAQVPHVLGDRIHVQQVLLNLLFNGMDAMGAVALENRTLHVTTSVLDGCTVEVAVRDGGHGIASDSLGRIFESFFTTKKDGLGLGLSIARSLVEAQGGRIRAENNVDGGATFRFTLLDASHDARATAR
jgi:PAS domain S-box-containing protein